MMVLLYRVWTFFPNMYRFSLQHHCPETCRRWVEFVNWLWVWMRIDGLSIFVVLSTVYFGRWLLKAPCGSTIFHLWQSSIASYTGVLMVPVRNWIFSILFILFLGYILHLWFWSILQWFKIRFVDIDTPHNSMECGKCDLCERYSSSKHVVFLSAIPEGSEFPKTEQ